MGEVGAEQTVASGLGECADFFRSGRTRDTFLVGFEFVFHDLITDRCRPGAFSRAEARIIYRRSTSRQRVFFEECVMGNQAAEAFTLPDFALPR